MFVEVSAEATSNGQCEPRINKLSLSQYSEFNCVCCSERKARLLWLPSIILSLPTQVAAAPSKTRYLGICSAGPRSISHLLLSSSKYHLLYSPGCPCLLAISSASQCLQQSEQRLVSQLLLLRLLCLYISASSLTWVYCSLRHRVS